MSRNWTDDPEIRSHDFVPKTRKCAHCGKKCARHSRRTRHIKDLGDSGPVVLALTIGVYWCGHCERFFASNPSHMAQPRAKYTSRAVETALRHLKNNDIDTTRRMLRKYSFLNIPLSTLHDMKWYAEYAKLNGTDDMDKRDVFKVKKIASRIASRVKEDFKIDPGAQLKKIKYDFPGRKGIIPEGAMLLTWAESC